MAIRCIFSGHDDQIQCEYNGEGRKIEYLVCERCGRKEKNREGGIYPHMIPKE